jgi:hypothetical protein
VSKWYEIAGRCENPEYHGIWRNITEYGGISRNITEYHGIWRNNTEYHDIFPEYTGTSQYFPMVANATVYKHGRTSDNIFYYKSDGFFSFWREVTKNNSILEVLYVVYIIITSVHQKFWINMINSSWVTTSWKTKVLTSALFSNAFRTVLRPVYTCKFCLQILLAISTAIFSF